MKAFATQLTISASMKNRKSIIIWAFPKSFISFSFNAIALAKKIRSHELLEFRRISAYLYKVNGKFVDSVQLSKEDGNEIFKFEVDANHIDDLIS